MSAAEALRAARNAGVHITVDGGDLILRASARPAAKVVNLLSRHKADILVLLAATAFESNDNRLRASVPLSESVAQSPIVEPGPEEPCADRRGRVAEENCVLLHFCVECGRLGPFGVGVSLRRGQMGRWYCREHRPNKKATPQKLEHDHAAERASRASPCARQHSSTIDRNLTEYEGE